MIAVDQGFDASAEVNSRFNDVHERIDELAAGMQHGFEDIRTLLANLTMQIVDSRNVSGSTIQMVGSVPQPLPAQLSGGGPSAPTPAAAPSAPSTPTPVRASTSAATVAAARLPDLSRSAWKVFQLLLLNRGVKRRNLPSYNILVL